MKATGIWAIAQCLLFTCSGLTSAARAQAHVFPGMSGHRSFLYSDLVALIERHEPRTVDELLPLIPQDYRRFYILMHSTGSDQPASGATPRMIFYGGDARLMLAIPSDSAGPNGKLVEAIEYKDDTHEFRSHLLKIEAGAHETSEIPGPSRALGRNARVADQPRACVACHGEPFHANFKGYNSWADAFGSLSRDGQDRIVVGSPEHAAYLLYTRKLQEDPGRLRFLPTPVAPARNFPGQIGFTNGAVTDPNSDFTDALADRNADRVAAVLLRHPLYDAFQFFLNGIIIGCFDFGTQSGPYHNDPQDFLPPLATSRRGYDFEAVRSAYRSRLIDDYQQIFARQELFQTLPLTDPATPIGFDLGCRDGACSRSVLSGPESVSGSDAFIFNTGAVWHYALGLMGIDAASYATERHASTFRMITPRHGMLAAIAREMENQLQTRLHRSSVRDRHRLSNLRDTRCGPLAPRSRSAIARALNRLRPFSPR